MRNKSINENVETKNSDNRSIRDILDTAGFLSGPLEPVGMGADLISGLISLQQGDYGRAGLSGLALVPGLGLAAGITKKGKKLKASDIPDEDEYMVGSMISKEERKAIKENLKRIREAQKRDTQTLLLDEKANVLRNKHNREAFRSMFRETMDNLASPTMKDLFNPRYSDKNVKRQINDVKKLFQKLKNQKNIEGILDILKKSE